MRRRLVKAIHMLRSLSHDERDASEEEERFLGQILFRREISKMTGPDLFQSLSSFVEPNTQQSLSSVLTKESDASHNKSCRSGENNG